MRFLIPAAALMLLAGPVLAQTTPAPMTTTPDAGAATPAPMTATPAPAAPGGPAMAAPPKKMVGHRMTLQQHFDMANTSHDGHLTKDQATAAKWTYVTKHFSAMDTAKKGFVTVEDIHAYAHMQRVSHKKPVAPAPAAPATSS